MQTILAKEEEKLRQKKCFNLKEILNFYSGSLYSKIGLEYERLSLDKSTLKNATYETMVKIIEEFAKISSWQLVYDRNIIIGAKSKENSSISLEPGCQLEISIEPFENIFDIDLKLSKIISQLDNIADKHNVIFLGYGITPVASEDEINLLKKERYKIMYEYLPYANSAEFCPKMMKQTAGIQVNIDYKNNYDAYNKLKFFNLIMPFLMGLSANSPFEKNALTNKKSIRAEVWRFSGIQRCGNFYKDIFSKIFFKKRNVVKNYINELLNVPMVYIEKEERNIAIKGKICFGEYIKNGFKKFKPSMDDFMLHQTLCFPDVRFKNYIEIRNHDSNNPNFALALCALYKGLCKNDFNNLLKHFSYLKISNIEKYNENIIEQGLDYKINKHKNAWNVIQEIFEFSYKNLSARERMYLKPIQEILTRKKTMADLIQEYDIQNAKDLIEFIK